MVGKWLMNILNSVAPFWNILGFGILLFEVFLQMLCLCCFFSLVFWHSNYTYIGVLAMYFMSHTFPTLLWDMCFNLNVFYIFIFHFTNPLFCCV